VPIICNSKIYFLKDAKAEKIDKTNKIDVEKQRAEKQRAEKQRAIRIQKIKKAIIFSFSLIQNSLTIEQIDAYLINIHNIFCNPYHDQSVVESLEEIKTEMINRGQKISYCLFDMQFFKEFL
jgi:hypothetical protein